MKIHQRKNVIDGLEDNECLYVERVNREKLRIVFYNWGTNVEKFFGGTEEIETIYEVSGSGVSVLYWRLFLRKITFNSSTTFNDIENICDELGLIPQKVVW